MFIPIATFFPDQGHVISDSHVNQVIQGYVGLPSKRGLIIISRLD